MKLLKNLKNAINENNKTKIIGLLTILVALWLVLYLIPDILVSLFNTFLGNIILLIIVILQATINYKYGIIMALIFLIIKRFIYLSGFKKEGFTWTDKSTNDFLLIQNTLNPGIVFDTKIIQESQASQEEVDYFNKHGIWPWSQEVINLYTESVSNNPYVRTYSKDSVMYARKIYNEAAILRVMAMQSKEGQLLINGVFVTPPEKNKNEDLASGFGDFGYESGLIEHLEKDIIKCKLDNSGLERILHTGKGGIFGQQTKEVSDVNTDDLESIIPGFSFINGPCNPCVALNQNPDYSCPFKLNTKKKSYFSETESFSSTISDVWKYLWNI